MKRDKKIKIILVIAAVIIFWPLIRKVFTIGAIVAMVIAAIYFLTKGGDKK